jgi:hypothetical protein
MDTPPARSPSPETLAPWIAPPSDAEGQGPLFEALVRAARLRASGGLMENTPNALIALLTGGR